MRPVRYKKAIAIDLHKQGLSYSEIEQILFLPKSTLSFWLKKVELTSRQRKKLRERQLRAGRAGLEKKNLRKSQVIETIQNSSAQAIQKISKRELWLMGIILYWRERFLNGNENDLRKGVHFTSSDPNLVRLFLKWLKDIGQITNEEIKFDIVVGEDKKNMTSEVIAYWAKTMGFPEYLFSHIYFQKIRKKKSKRKILKKSEFGLLRLRVQASSMLARQISGWIKG